MTLSEPEEKESIPSGTATEPSADRLRLKLRCKVRYHTGLNCAHVDHLVEESLARFSQAGHPLLICNTPELGAFLNRVCHDVILEHHRRISGNLARRVLVADDKPASRELIRTVLENSGHSVWEAVDGTEAVRCAREILPDLIVLDLQMPALDGFGVLRELRSHPRFARTPIVALTATAMQGDRERALSAGFSSYISKPISLNALRNEIQRWLA